MLESSEKFVELTRRTLYWICCDGVTLHPGNVFYVPNIMSNFQLNWLSIFLGWKWPIWATF